MDRRIGDRTRATITGAFRIPGERMNDSDERAGVEGRQVYLSGVEVDW